MTRLLVLNLFLLLLFLSTSVNASTTPEQQGKSIKHTTAKAYSALDHHIIKIGVFYTSDLLNTYTIEQINRYVLEQINAANVVMENSGLAIRRELGYLGIHPIKNMPNERIEDFLSRIRGNEGAENRAIARQYGLDYVTVIRPMNDNRFCGWAYYGDPYAILQMGGRCTSNTLAAHEWGHNDGADHDIANSSAQPIRAYGHGYFCGGEGTIMSSPSGNKWNTRHNFYSSPNTLAGGQACGEQDTANVVRMLNELKDNDFHLGNRMSSPERLAFVRFSAEQPVMVKESDGVLPINIELVDAQQQLTTLGQSATIELITHQGTALANAIGATNDYQGVAKHIVFQPGESKKSVNLALVADAVNEEDETLKLVLRHGDVVDVLTPELAVTITETTIVTPTKVEFSQSDRVVLSPGQSQNIVLTRSGNTDNEFTAYLGVSNAIVSLSSEEIVFGINETSAFINITANETIKGESTLIKLTNNESQLGDNASIEVYLLADEIISFNEHTDLTAKAGDTVTLILSRTGELLTEIDVEVELSDSWMTMSNNIVHFNEQQISQSFNVALAADSGGQSGTVRLNLAAENKGNITKRVIKVANKAVLPNNSKQPSSGGSSDWLLIISLCLIVKCRSKRFIN